jgi:hypothetical protein
MNVWNDSKRLVPEIVQHVLEIERNEHLIFDNQNSSRHQTAIQVCFNLSPTRERLKPVLGSAI